MAAWVGGGLGARGEAAAGVIRAATDVGAGVCRAAVTGLGVLTFASGLGAAGAGVVRAGSSVAMTSLSCCGMTLNNSGAKPGFASMKSTAA
jgi:hypothetical protein